MSKRFSMGVVSAEISHDDGSVIPVITGGDNEGLSLIDYSRFKYGDGSVAAAYGRKMAAQLLDARPELLEQPVVHVASSAFKVAPPAAHALLRPFVDQAQQEATQYSSGTAFVPFKIYRQALTSGDYAGLDLQERQKVMESNNLQLSPGVNLDGGTVIVLDDIRVTGSHEQAIERVLGPAALEGLYHGYVLSVAEGSNYPQLEAAINATAVTSITDVVELSHEPGFIPNARLCKFVLSQSMEDIADFCRRAPGHVVTMVGNYMRGDELHLMGNYTEGYGRFAGATLAEAEDILTVILSLTTVRRGTRDWQPPHDTELNDEQRTFREQIRFGARMLQDPEDDDYYRDRFTFEQIELVLDLMVHKGLIRKDRHGFWHATNAGENKYTSKRSRTLGDRFTTGLRDIKGKFW